MEKDNLFENLEKTITRIKMDNDTRYDDVLLNEQLDVLKEFFDNGRITADEYEHGRKLLSW